MYFFQGVRGLPGARGIPGEPGPRGAKGQLGYNGLDGPPGAKVIQHIKQTSIIKAPSNKCPLLFSEQKNQTNKQKQRF